MRSILFGHLALVVFSGLVAFAPKAQAAPPWHVEEKRFLKLDFDRDKMLTMNEFIGEKAGKSKAKAQKQFKALDKNGDKALSFKEFYSK